MSSNANSAASKYKYNGVELEEALGLDLYEMTYRLYDPAVARFLAVDPVTHFNNSPYTAFDNNPVLFYDPAGADSEFGTDHEAHRNKYINNGAGMFQDQDNIIDKAAVKSLKGVASAVFSIDGETFNYLSENDKQEIFETDAIATIGVLLWEFATGSGKNERDFELGKHPFANQILSGRILEEIQNEFNQKARADNYDFVSLEDSKEYTLSLEFSPNKRPSSWLESLVKHADSNASQFFVGGAIAYVQIKNNNFMIQIYNETSRNSLMLHIANNYNRNDNDKENRELSTIKQNINASIEIQQ